MAHRTRTVPLNLLPTGQRSSRSTKKQTTKPQGRSSRYSWARSAPRKPSERMVHWVTTQLSEQSRRELDRSKEPGSILSSPAQSVNWVGLASDSDEACTASSAMKLQVQPCKSTAWTDDFPFTRDASAALLSMDPERITQNIRQMMQHERADGNLEDVGGRINC